MKKVIFFIGLIIIVATGVFFSYSSYFKQNTKSDYSTVGMTQGICEESSGKWREMESVTAEEYSTDYFCECRKLFIPTIMSVWIDEGVKEKCP